MFSKLLGNVKKQRQLHSWRKSALGRSINEHTRSQDKFWAHLDKERKQQLISEFYAKIFALLDSPDALPKCRKELVANVVAYTDLQILCLTEQDKEKISVFNDMTRISSDLHDHIYKCTLLNEELNKYIEENGYDESELLTFVNNRCQIYRYYAYGFDIVRKNIEAATEKDWFLPLVQSSIIISESKYRKYLGLPAIVSAIDSSFHTSFIDMVQNCEPDPLLTWEKRFAKLHSDTV
jgi:hypothetical protein